MLYNGPIELLKAAVNKGIINIGRINVRVGNIDVETPGAINILKPDEWKIFLQDVIDATDDVKEKNFANTFLQTIQRVEIIVNNQLKNQGQIISDATVNTFSKALTKCHSFDDVLGLVEANTKRLPVVQHQSVSKIQQPTNTQSFISNLVTDKKNLLNALTWKKVLKVINTYRYYAYEINWFIQRQESIGPKGGVNYYYSIFTPQKREVARYDRLKDAKSDMLKVIKRLSS